MNMRELLECVPTLRKLGAAEVSLKTLYGLKRILDKLEENLNFYEDVRREVIQKYCENRDGQTVAKIGMEKIASDKIAELLDMEIVLDGVEKVKIPIGEGVRLSYSELTAVSAFVELEDEKGDLT